MTGVEVAFIVIAGIGLIFSGVVGINISTSAPERFKMMENRAKHGFRSKVWKKNIYIALTSARIPFLAICDYLSHALRDQKLECSENGTQYVTVSVHENTFNWNIPETNCDVKLLDYNILIRIGGEYHGSAGSFYVYYDDANEYKRFSENVLQPFAMKVETMKQKNITNQIPAIYKDQHRKIDEEIGSQFTETERLLDDD
jgi:hypothetical protein